MAYTRIEDIRPEELRFDIAEAEREAAAYADLARGYKTLAHLKDTEQTDRRRFMFESNNAMGKSQVCLEQIEKLKKLLKKVEELHNG